MPTISLQAHFDGKHIVLDEPFELPAHASLMVTLLPGSPDEASEVEWLRAAATSEAFAFLAEPEQDIYTVEDAKPIE